MKFSKWLHPRQGMVYTNNLIIDKKSGIFKIVAPETGDGLYKASVVVSYHQNEKAFVKSAPNGVVWHHRLGHFIYSSVSKSI